MEIHLVGPFPPPYGGVSVHIGRLRYRLMEAGHRCTVWCNHERPNENMYTVVPPWAGSRWLAHVPADAILHFHDYHLLAGLSARRRARVLFTVHNERINHTLRGGQFPRQWLYRRIAAHYFRRVPRLIAVSARAKAELVNFGFPPDQIDILNAYLPPGPDERAHPDNLAAFEQFRRRFGLVATANAWALHFFQGQDLYGMDMCLELVARLRSQHPDFGVALAVPLGRGTEYLAALQASATRLGVSEHVLWLLEPGAFHPILRQCDLFLRPTNTDGFSVSIAEAFEFGVPVVASDAIPRPPACVLFRKRDVDDFVEKVRQTLANRPALAEQARAGREPDHFPEILARYEELAR